MRKSSQWPVRTPVSRESEVFCLSPSATLGKKWPSPIEEIETIKFFVDGMWPYPVLSITQPTPPQQSGDMQCPWGQLLQQRIGLPWSSPSSAAIVGWQGSMSLFWVEIKGLVTCPLTDVLSPMANISSPIGPLIWLTHLVFLPSAFGT